MYKLIQNLPGLEQNVVQRLADNAFIPFDPANTDYQQFLQHLAQGLPVEAVDGTVMTESEIAALYQTLTQPGT
jgi:hypothetical protein